MFNTFLIAVTVFLRPPTVATGACVLMALASLRFQRNAQDCEETRQGMTVFAGDAASFHEWPISSSDQEVVMQGRRPSCTDGESR